MGNKTVIHGLAILSGWLLASSVSSFLGTVGILGAATDFTQGVLDGLAVVAFGAAIVILVRGRRSARE